MSTPAWDKDEIKKLTVESGKPLEVRCAEIFLKSGWRVVLGTYFKDFTNDKIRELDFLAEKNLIYEFASNLMSDPIVLNICFRILGSCKGFPENQNPATFSVSSPQMMTQPAFLVYDLGHGVPQHIKQLRRDAAQEFLVRAKLAGGQQIVGFDIFERKETVKKNESTICYSRNTDKTLFEGLDSAVKAALYWFREDTLRESRISALSNRMFVGFNIPLLVLSRPAWNVSIDGGTSGEPEIKASGFHASLYPIDEKYSPLTIMSLIWSETDLTRLLEYLEQSTEFQSFDLRSRLSCTVGG